MKTLCSFACLLVLIAFATQSARADIAKPTPSEQPSKVLLHTRLHIVPDANTYQARLQISQSDLQELRASLDAAGSGNTFVAANVARSPVRTIVAGVLLFLSVSFAGVWLARTRRTSAATKVAAAGVVVIAVLGAAAIITRGNAGPPPGFMIWKNLPKNLSEGRESSGQVMIEVVPDSTSIPSGMRLLIPVRDKKQTGDE